MLAASGASRGWSRAAGVRPQELAASGASHVAAAWTPLASLGGPLVEFGAAAADGTIYVVGGYVEEQGGTVQNATLSLPGDGSAKAWTTLAPMPTARNSLTAAYVESTNSVLAIAGSTGHETPPGSKMFLTDKVEALDLSTGKWSSDLPSLPLALAAPAAAAMPGINRVLVTGGFGYDASGMFFYSNKTFLLDVEKKRWETVEDFPWGRSGLACSTVLSARLELAISGSRPANQEIDNLATTSLQVDSGVLCYGGGAMDPAYPDAALFDSTKQTWTKVAPMLEARNWFGGARIRWAGKAPAGGDAVYAVGGYCCDRSTGCFFSPLASVEQYNFTTNTWTEIEAMPMPHGGGSAVAPVASTIVSVGGDGAGDVLAAKLA